jgi:hypothetical protein
VIPAGIPKPKAETPAKRIRMSEANAQLLTQKGLLVRIFDHGTNSIVATTCEPWMLAHKEWVVKVEGKTGGWSCANLSVITRATRVTFEDHGQDFSVWTIHDGKVIECGPFQSDIWVGCKVLTTEFAVGEKVKVLTLHDEQMMLHYPIAKVECFTGKVVAL